LLRFLLVLVFAIVAAIFAIYHSFVLFISLISTMSLVVYFIALLEFSKKKKAVRTGANINIPFYFVFSMLLVPIVVTVFYTFELSSGGQPIYSIIVAFGMSLTFLYSFVNLPLAIYHKKIETEIPEPLIKPLVTIIVPAFNEQVSLKHTIESLIECDYPNKEILIIDDGSTDRTYEIANSFAQKSSNRGIIVIRKENGGKSSAINYGLQFAKGDIVVILDADSIIGRDALKELVKYFQYPDVVAVGGNIKASNRWNIITNCQALEYLIGINLFKRAFDIFGTVMVVPGALGAFRKSALIERGEYDKDTLTEDFDATIKLLKSGRSVQGSSFALSYTEAPSTLRDFYKQRIRWYRGNLQTLIKHRDIITSRKNRMLNSYAYPASLLTMLLLPLLGIIVSAVTILALINGEGMSILLFFSLFVCMQVVLSAIAITMDNEDWKLLIFSPFFVVGYKQIIDIVTLKGILDVIFKKNLKWTSPKRMGYVKRNDVI
jgi:peptidoglycan-N-acetylglucosamine deacetylase